MNRGKNKNCPKWQDNPNGGNLHFPLFRSPATTDTRSVQKVADGRVEWQEATALSYEICRGITAFGRYYHDALATSRKVVVPAARRLAPSLF